MITLSNKATYKPVAVRASFLLLLFIVLAAWDWRRSVVACGFFFVLAVLSFLARKTVRELTLDGHRLDLTYAQWGRNYSVTYDTRQMELKMISDMRGIAALRAWCLGIYDENHRLLFRVRPGDGYEMADLQAVADAAKS